MKINLWWLVAIVALAIIIGGFIGYGIYMSNNNKKDIINTTTDQLQELVEKNVEKPNEESKVDNTETAKQTPKYDGSKTIIVNGEKHTISYINEPTERYLNLKTEEDAEDFEEYNVTLYFDNKELITYENIGNYQKAWNTDPEIELNSIIGKNKNDVEEDYILITLNGYYVAPALNREFCVIDIKGNILGDFYGSGGEQIIIKNGKERTGDATRFNCENVEINKDNIILYDIVYLADQNDNDIESKIFGIKYKISIVNGILQKEILYIYTNNDAEFAGK